MEETQKNERPPYRRGTGLKVIICYEDDENVKALVRANRAAGNELFVDDRGRIYALVCKYPMCVGHEVSNGKR